MNSISLESLRTADSPQWNPTKSQLYLSVRILINRYQQRQISPRHSFVARLIAVTTEGSKQAGDLGFITQNHTLYIFTYSSFSIPLKDQQHPGSSSQKWRRGADDTLLRFLEKRFYIAMWDSWCKRSKCNTACPCIVSKEKCANCNLTLTGFFVCLF